MTREQAARSPGKAKASAKKTASSGTTGKSKSRKPRRS
jgi:ribonuclease R